MNDQRSDTADWVVPATLVAVGVALLGAFIIVLVLTDTGRAQPEGLVEELDVYTRCLTDHGANVPRIEARRDGGFSVTVPGSMIEEGLDTDAMREAYDQCADVAPDLFGGLAGLLTDGVLGGRSHGIPGGLFDDAIQEVIEGV